MTPKQDEPEIVEVPIANDIARMNLNEATSGNNQNPAFGTNLNKNAPRWAKILFVLFIIFIVGVSVLGLAVSLFH